MPRLVKTQTQFEGRFEETWTLVEESDELPPWEEDARADGRRHAAPAPGRRAARDRRGALHGRRRAAGDAAHGRAALAARPRAASALDLDAARAVPGVRAAVGPQDELVASGRPAAQRRRGVRRRPRRRGRRRHRRRGGGGPARPRPAVGGAAVLDLRRRGDRRAALPRRAGGGHPRRRGGRHGRGRRAVEFALETPGHLQTPLEPHGAVAWWQPRADGWVSTQGMFAARDELCRRFGIERERVRVRTDYVGGGFGGKQGAGPRRCSRRLSRLTRRPVRVQRPPRRAARRRPPRRARGRACASGRRATGASSPSMRTRSCDRRRRPPHAGADARDDALPLRRRARPAVPLKVNLAPPTPSAPPA